MKALEQDMWKIYRALNAGDFEAIKCVVAHNPDVLTSRTWLAGATWLHYAAEEGMLEAVQLLLDMGADVNFPAYLNGDGALVRAAARGQVESVKLLLDRGAGLDVTKSENNPLLAAISGASPEVTRLLLDHGIDTGIVYAGDMDAAAWALVWGQTEIAHMIVAHLSNGNADRTRQLLEQAKQRAARHGELRRVHIIPTEDDVT